jgi:F-type H+-transporting ATPase subunit alpha
MSNANYIVEQLEKKLASFDAKETRTTVGSVVSIFDGIAQVSGLRDIAASEMVEFSGGQRGIALNLDEDTVGIIILGEYIDIAAGDTVKALGVIAEVPVGDAFLGRVVDAFAVPIDGQGDIVSNETKPIERIAPGVMSRQSVSEPVQTGIAAIDALIPIGRGQRELLIGDRQTGKTTIAIDTILNQKDQNMICVYVSIGQKDSKLRSIESQLREKGAMDYTIIVRAGAADSAAMNYVVPYAGTALAEYFLDQGKDVLVIYDDLTKHAASYREISLLLRRPPGREAFPGDVFYLHSRLLERSCRLNKNHGGGSITSLPIVETQAGDVSAYIPTNVISITDGQIFLETNLFYKGIRPAVNVGLSVSRVGSSAQIKAMKKTAGTLKLDLAQFRELEAFAQFGSDLDEGTRAQLDRGQRSIEILKQKQYSPFLVEDQVIRLYALTRGYMDKVPVDQVREYANQVVGHIKTMVPAFVDGVRGGMWTPESEEELKIQLQVFTDEYISA